MRIARMRYVIVAILLLKVSGVANGQKSTIQFELDGRIGLSASGSSYF